MSKTQKVKCKVCRRVETANTTSIDPYLAIVWHIQRDHPAEYAKAAAGAQ